MNNAVPQRFDQIFRAPRDGPADQGLICRADSRDHAEITVMRAISTMGELPSVITTFGVKMTAELLIFDVNRTRRNDSIDQTERLFSALGRYTSAELLELLYVGEEPGFFELVRGLFALSDESRLILQEFLATSAHRAMTASIDPEGRCILIHGTSEQRESTVTGIAR